MVTIPFHQKVVSYMSHYQINQSKFLTPQEQDMLMLKLAKCDNKRDVLLIRTALATGARAQELLNVKRTDLRKNESSIFIRGLKGSYDREIPVKPELFDQLLTLSENQEMLFDIGYPRLVQIWNAIRPVNKTWHSLRHTFAIELFKRTRDLRLCQLALGHSGIQNTIV